MKFHTVISTVVKADLKTAWPQLWRKAYETKDFVPGLQSLKIHSKTEDEIHRQMSVGPTTIIEKIIKQTHTKTVYFHNLYNSDVQGLIYNLLYVNQQNQLILEFGSNAINKEGNIFPPTQLFGKALEKTKLVMEESK